MQFTVAGETSGKTFHSGSSIPSREEHYEFSARIADCKWLIRIAGNPAFDYIETGTDGTNIFTLIQNETFRKEHNVKNAGIGCVRNGPVPHVPESPVSSIIWYAYASSCYFQHVKNQIDLPFADVMRNQYDTNWLSDAVWKVQSAGPHVPMAIFFHRDRIKYWGQPTDALRKEPLERKMKAPYENGYTNAIFQIVSWTNVEGLIIPSDILYRTYAPIKGQLVVIQELEVLLHTVTPISVEQPTVPKIIGTAIVRDERFVSEKSPVLNLAYDAVDSWPTEKEVRSSKEFAREQAFGATLMVGTVRNSQKNRAVRIGFFIAAGISTAVFLRILWKMKTT